MSDYIFVADCCGLQSICQLEPEIFSAVNMHCKANVQRWATWGILSDLDDYIKEELDKMIDVEDRKITALKLLKNSSHIATPSKFNRNLLTMIPNPILDPYHTPTENEIRQMEI